MQWKVRTDLFYLALVDFALAEAGYTIVRIIQRFGTIKLPEGETVELTGVEKQVMTLVVAIADGCRLEMR